jgi:hypothetical protein
MRIAPWLEEHHRNQEHDEYQSRVYEREYPATTMIEAVGNLTLFPLIQRAHHQVDSDSWRAVRAAAGLFG